jgi:uncharacterized protein YkwD
MSRVGASTLHSVSVAAMVVFGTTLAVVPAQADGPDGPVGGDQGGAVLSEINATRAANGCGPVAANPALTASAERHARDMLVSGVAEHTGSDGSSLVQRVTDAGYTQYAEVGEVVFWGTGSAGNPATAVTSWMNSPGHRAIITDCGLTEAGFSAVSDGNKMTATGDFGTR